MKRVKVKHLLMIAALVVTVNAIIMAEFFQRRQEIILSAAAVEASPNEIEEIEDKKQHDPEAAIEQEEARRMVKVTQDDLDQIFHQREERVAYLTFDDGPSPNNTPRILEILEEEGIQATFFVLGKQAEMFPELVKEIHSKGHVIGNHTYSHRYKQIYSSIEAYMEDLKRSEVILKNILGHDYDLRLTRFPGGSFGKGKAPFREALREADYVHIDWNVLNGDGEVVTPTIKYLMTRYKATRKDSGAMVILMHDSHSKTTTVETLPEIIQDLKESGYRFDILPRTVEAPAVTKLDDSHLF